MRRKLLAVAGNIPELSDSVVWRAMYLYMISVCAIAINRFLSGIFAVTVVCVLLSTSGVGPLLSLAASLPIATDLLPRLSKRPLRLEHNPTPDVDSKTQTTVTANIPDRNRLIAIAHTLIIYKYIARHTTLSDDSGILPATAKSFLRKFSLPPR